MRVVSGLVRHPPRSILRPTFRTAGVVVAVTVVLTGCIGARSRSDFEALQQERGGGLSAASIESMVTTIEDRSGSPDPEIRTGRINTIANTAVFEVRNPARPAELDRYTFRDDDLIDVEPVRLDGDDELDAQSVPISTFALAEIEQIGDRALVEFDSSGGYVTGVTLLAMTDPPQMRVDVESPRASGTALFDAGGNFLEFNR